MGYQPPSKALCIELAHQAGFDLAGVAPAAEVPEYQYYTRWVEQGFAGAMGYLTDHRAALRRDPRALLPSAQSVICLGKLYKEKDLPSGHIAAYARSEDYHDVLRRLMETLRQRLTEAWGPFESKMCVDTAPLLERGLARRAGLGWIGRNTCLINEGVGSWLFLCEILVSVPLPPSEPGEFRCGTCTRCIDACPTQALVPVAGSAGPEYALDSRRCISYTTIELRGAIPAESREGVGQHLFGCDICQEVCPWNSKTPDQLKDPVFAPQFASPALDEAAMMTAAEFRERYRSTPVSRAKHGGFRRNAIVAMGNSGDAKYVPVLETLAQDGDPLIEEHARWALSRLRSFALR